jgi:DNA-binding LacI/PurR family transcriptional regulator
MVSDERPLTLADIARLAGVGAATASRALNEAAGVAPATRRRIQEIARAHGYVISPAAASLAAGVTRRVGLVVPHLSRWFQATTTEAIHSVLAAAGLDVLMYLVGRADERRAFFDRLPARRNVDALVVVGVPVGKAEQLRLESVGVHVVAAGGQSVAFPHVSIDDRATGRLAVRHLVNLGHRRIATIEAEDPDQVVQPRDRSRAYDDVLAEAGVAVDPRLRVVIDWGGEQAAAAMAGLLAGPVRPTAVYAHSDEVALGAIRTIRRAGLRVPDDVSVVGIDDAPPAALADLTTVRQPVWEQGIRAGRMVVDLLRTGVLADTSVILPTELVVRRTTAPPRDSADAPRRRGTRRRRGHRGRSPT